MNPTTSQVWLKVSSNIIRKHVSVILNNSHGRQFNSLNDVAIISPRNKELCSTDVAYIVVQVFSQPVYEFNLGTATTQVVANMLNTPNGIAFPLVGGTRLLRHDPLD